LPTLLRFGITDPCVEVKTKKILESLI